MESPAQSPCSVADLRRLLPLLASSSDKAVAVASPPAAQPAAEGASSECGPSPSRCHPSLPTLLLHPHRLPLTPSQVQWLEQQVAKRRTKRDVYQEPTDPKFPQQWYLVRGLLGSWVLLPSGIHLATEGSGGRGRLTWRPPLILLSLCRALFPCPFLLSLGVALPEFFTLPWSPGNQGRHCRGRWRKRFWGVVKGFFRVPLTSHSQPHLVSAGVMGRVSLQSGVTQRDLNVKEAWAQGYTGHGIVVSILDDGIEKNHPDLAGNYVRRWGGRQ